MKLPINLVLPYLTFNDTTIMGKKQIIIAYRLRESISFWNFIYLNSERKGLISKIDCANKKLLFSGI